MANFACIAAARDWCAERHGRRAGTSGLASMPQVPVFSAATSTPAQ